MNKLKYIHPRWVILLFLFISLILLTNQEAPLSAALGKNMQQTALWTPLNEVPATSSAESYLRVERFQPYTVDKPLLQALLNQAPMELTSQAPIEIQLPRPDGTMERFNLVESPIMAPELAAKFPEIKTFSGQGIDDPTATTRLDITPAGFHAQVFSASGAYYIDPYFHLDDSVYASYFRADMIAAPEEFMKFHPIHTLGEYHGANIYESVNQSSALLRSGTQLRTYRTAVAAQGEYTAFHGGTVALGQAAIVTAMNRINQVYENELAIRLELVANNNLLVYTNPATDPYPSNNTNSINQNQAVIDGVIGSANYDVGHVFNTGGGGLAGLGVVGNPARKAEGVTGSSNPIGDSFWVGLAAHEFGHQFDAEHTFNGDSVNCSAGNRSATSAYEPGSGSTIMAYAGICGNDNLQSDSDPYFHSRSFDQIIDFVDNDIPLVGTRTATGNTVPTASAGGDYTIPASTPFELTGSGSDADGDTLTYNWEQRDLGPQQDVNAGDNGSSPLFRSFMPDTNPVRIFPRLSDLLNNTTVIGETLPTTTRTMNFRFTVRDNRAGGGGVNTDDMVLNVVNTGTPFAVTSPNTAVSWTGGTVQSIMWDVAGTTANGINTANVNILLSTDGGLNFSYTLATTTNDGSHSITVPNIDTTSARIKVEGDGNIFFDLSNVDFTITSNPTLPGLSITETDGDTRPVEGGSNDSYQMALNTNPAGTVTVQISAVDEVEVSLDNTTFAASQSVDFNATTPQTIYVRAIDDSDEEGPHTARISHSITASTSADYPTTMLINDVIAHIYDNELPPVIGLDFDCCGGSAPTNWSQVTFVNQDSTDMMRDDGVATTVDLNLTAFGSLNASTIGPISTELPRHNPVLTELDGHSRGSATVTARWEDLTPGNNYGVYVFGFERADGVSYSQSVVIAGATTLPAFDQVLVDGQLQVNDEVGTNTRTLQSFEHVVAADGSGHITLTITPNVGSDGVSFAGFALREIPSSVDTTEVALNSGMLTITDINGDDSDDALTISYAGGTYTISDSGGLTIETAVAGATGSGTGTVTVPDTGVTGINFNMVGGDDSVTVSSVQASLTGGFIVSGGDGSDTVNVNGAINSGAGSINMTAETINTTGALSGNGGINLNADSVSLGANLSGTGTLTLVPVTASTTIGLGGGLGSFNLDDTELAFLQDGFSSITIGDSNAGDVTVNTVTFNDPLTLRSGGNITDAGNSGIDITNTGNTVTFDGTLSPGASPGTISVIGDVAFASGSTYFAELGTSFAGPHDLLDVTGSVTLGGNVALNVDDTNFPPTDDTSGTIVIIANDGGDAISGAFSNYAEGDQTSNGSDPNFLVGYTRGDGNDVGLTNASPTAVTLNEFSSSQVRGERIGLMVMALLGMFVLIFLLRRRGEVA